MTDADDRREATCVNELLSASGARAFSEAWAAYVLDAETVLIHDHATGRLARVKPEFLRWLVHARLTPGQSVGSLLGWEGSRGT